MQQQCYIMEQHLKRIGCIIVERFTYHESKFGPRIVGEFTTYEEPDKILKTLKQIEQAILPNKNIYDYVGMKKMKLKDKTQVRLTLYL